MEQIYKMLRYPEKLRCDLRLHMLIGVVLVAIIAPLTLNPYILLPILVLVSYGIEFYQRWTKSGHFDHWDAIAVMLGGLTVYASHIQI